MLFLATAPRLLILVSRYHLLVTNLMLAKALNAAAAVFKAWDVRWFCGIHELLWILEVLPPCYSAVLVLGAVLRGDTEHAVLLGYSFYRSCLYRPVVSFVVVADTKEAVWRKVFATHVNSLAQAMCCIVSRNCGLLV
ncbi:MAG: 6,7-dimethyl-8-ribityllumazine synthase [Candidatus Hodgkinia cicadicola]